MGFIGAVVIALIFLLKDKVRGVKGGLGWFGTLLVIIALGLIVAYDMVSISYAILVAFFFSLALYRLSAALQKAEYSDDFCQGKMSDVFAKASSMGVAEQIYLQRPLSLICYL